MHFDQYQKWTLRTAQYPVEIANIYTALGLAGECGEVCEKIKKVYRDNNGVVTSEVWNSLLLECGDVLWYLARLTDELGMSLDLVARKNVEKLTKRLDEDKICGDGDDR